MIDVLVIKLVIKLGNAAFFLYQYHVIISDVMIHVEYAFIVPSAPCWQYCYIVHMLVIYFYTH